MDRMVAVVASWKSTVFRTLQSHALAMKNDPTTLGANISLLLTLLINRPFLICGKSSQPLTPFNCPVSSNPTLRFPSASLPFLSFPLLNLSVSSLLQHQLPSQIHRSLRPVSTCQPSRLAFLPDDHMEPFILSLSHLPSSSSTPSHLVKFIHHDLLYGSSSLSPFLYSRYRLRLFLP